MRLRLALLCLGLLLSSACKGHSDAPPPATPPTPQVATGSTAQERIATDLRALADDAMEGRLTGTPGFDRAADYVAARMAEAGLQPAGADGGWFQHVPLLRGVRQREGAQLRVRHPDRDVSLRFGDQFLPQPNLDAAQAAVEAEAVFVGQAVHAPAAGRDDFAGLDLAGKIAVFFPGAPEHFGDTQRAHYSAMWQKLQAVAERGAVGAVIVESGDDELRNPWTRTAAAWQRPAMRLRDAQGRAIGTEPGLKVVAVVAATAADLVFDGSGRSAAQAYAELREGGAGYALPVRIALAARTRIETLESRNVLGRLPGTDPARAGQALVQTAHLDHLGVAAEGDGDRILNGALDNALGVAIVLESARMLAAQTPQPARSVVFAALTGEEQGLLGGYWLARHPPAGLQWVANINLDMPLLLAPSTDVVPIGMQHSSLQAVVEAQAQAMGVALSPDPFPEETVFVRSDQYAFVRAGVPALYLSGGVISADGQRQPTLAQRVFMREHYHRPSDDATLPVYWPDAERLARLAAGISRGVADDPKPPRWNEGDFFGTPR